ncbi:hypothetical protein D6D13_08707 [Aureobasidium pullulans]|uniref:Uncharacterized protein n=1 Tax=Aureobasidium pullulans TaxID=5580 RepID=A0A4S9C5J0_AURPU|nr:hypothetical protein D6D13_08707 [Aureobasidium pullulans]
MTSPYVDLCHAHAIEMHNIFEISAALHREPNNIRHGRRRWLEVTEFSTRGGRTDSAYRA